jgi:hypothetical protein
VRLHDIDGLSATHPLLAVDRHRQLDVLGGHLLEPEGERLPFRTAWGVVVYRFVHRMWEVGHSIHDVSFDAAVEIWGISYR